MYFFLLDFLIHLDYLYLLNKEITIILFQDQVIIPLTESELRGRGADPMAEDQDPVLVVHPNYVLDQ